MITVSETVTEDWTDLGQRIARAITSLESVAHDPVRITSKIEGVQAAQKLYLDLGAGTDSDVAWKQLRRSLEVLASHSAAEYQQGIRLALSYMRDYR